ncbi:hypothetical protein QL285_079326 [Trifolium repens]|nr:hypothetical protein QL285_079322 [Trifolium repens]KAK2365881.1 hypothetical protein QL285_079324 [Trifolium repens]KAK2365883.1 hypothetical protein QL285_079326 [Trifolium repens]
MQEFKVKTQRKEENQRKMRKLTRHGQHKASQRQGAPKVARHQVAKASVRRAYSPWREDHSRGEQRRPKSSELTWQKPTGEVTSTRHGELFTRHSEFIRTEPL